MHKSLEFATYVREVLFDDLFFLYFISFLFVIFMAWKLNLELLMNSFSCSKNSCQLVIREGESWWKKVHLKREYFPDKSWLFKFSLHFNIHSNVISAVWKSSSLAPCAKLPSLSSSFRLQLETLHRW